MRPGRAGPGLLDRGGEDMVGPWATGRHEPAPRGSHTAVIARHK